MKGNYGESKAMVRNRSFGGGEYELLALSREFWRSEVAEIAGIMNFWRHSFGLSMKVVKEPLLALPPILAIDIHKLPDSRL